MPEYTIPVTPTTEDPNYIAEMVSKADGGPKPDEGSLLAGKYKSEAELEKGILELDRKSVV